MRYEGFVRIMAADPGSTGALAFGDIVPDTGAILDVRVYDMPVSETCDVFTDPDKGKVSLQPDETLILSLIRREAPDMGVLEHLSPRPPFMLTKTRSPGAKQGGAAQEWKTAMGYAIIRSAMRVYFADTSDGPAVFPVRPEVWKKALGLTSVKDESRIMAIEHFPAQADYLKRKKDHNRAEAMLLLRYFALQVLPKGAEGVRVF